MKNDNFELDVLTKIWTISPKGVCLMSATVSERNGKLGSKYEVQIWNLCTLELNLLRFDDKITAGLKSDFTRLTNKV